MKYRDLSNPNRVSGGFTLQGFRGVGFRVQLSLARSIYIGMC